MNHHELILLSPYRYPSQTALNLSADEMAAWLNGYTALWHPALLLQASGPPRVESSYDHENPKSGVIYALPDSEHHLSNEWHERVRAAGSHTFQSYTSREATLANLTRTIAESKSNAQGWSAAPALTSECLQPFFGLGMGYLALSGLSEAMEHSNPLDSTAFWSSVQNAVTRLVALPLANPNEEEIGGNLRQAAHALLTARQVLYPVTIHLLDFCFVDDKHLDQPWPRDFCAELCLNVVASGKIVEELARLQPAKLAAFRDAVNAGHAEICGGDYLEREEPFMSTDSQLWNLRKGLKVTKDLVGEVRVFGRKRFGFHPQLPLLLAGNGLTKALCISMDDAFGLSNTTACVAAWPSPDGKQIDVFTRRPMRADSAETFFNLAYSWFKTTREDHAATLAFMHTDIAPAPWYGDLVALAKLAPVLGTWESVSGYFTEVMSNEHPWTPLADDFHSDYLSERVRDQVRDPVSGFAKQARVRRRIDSCYTLTALHHSLGNLDDIDQRRSTLTTLEDACETSASADNLRRLEDFEKVVAGGLTDRLQASAATNVPGYMVLNSCAFTRRIALELDRGANPLAIDGPVKSCQLDADKLRVVVDVPSLGFAWIAREGAPGTPPMPTRLRLADPATLTMRNEFFEAEIDPGTGGLRAIRDHKTRINRVGQRLVFNPGSRMVAKDVRVTSRGPALGEIVATGEIQGDQQQVLATYSQRSRVWLGRPLLDLRIELHPVQRPAGYPWHAYFGSRFAWRDERTMLLRGSHGSTYTTTHTRPQANDFVELRVGGLSTAILTGGMPFHQRQEGRMLDVILVPQGEEETVFEMGIALDRDQPAQTALGYTSPTIVVPTTKGPPHIGASGWLYHLDSSSMLLSQLYPGALGNQNETGRAVTARLLECGGMSGHAQFRCVRNPKRAAVLDASGQVLVESQIDGDAVHVEVSPNDLVMLQVEF